MKWIDELKQKWFKSQEEKIEKEYQEKLLQIQNNYKNVLENKELELKIQKDVLDSEFKKITDLNQELLLQQKSLLEEAQRLDLKKKENEEFGQLLRKELDDLIASKEVEKQSFLESHDKKLRILSDEYESKFEKGTMDLKTLENNIFEQNERLSKLHQELKEKGEQIIQKIEEMEKGLLDKERLYQEEIQEFNTLIAKNKSEHEIRLSYENRLIEESEFQAKKKKEEVEYFEAKLNDRKNELEKANQELKEQIRVLEAKARPDSVWTEAFAAGHEKAWDFTIPILLKDYETLKKKIHDEAVDTTLKNLDPVVLDRLEEVGKTNLKTNLELLNKRTDFETKLTNAKTDQDKIKYRSYIEAINWALNGNTLQAG